MPVSKKPPRKATPTSPRPKAAAADLVLPDRQAMESYLATIAGQSCHDAIARAQDIIYDAWERATSRSRITLARKALAISPLCADGYNLLAEEAGSVQEARDLRARGVAASRRGSWRSGPKGSRNMQGTSGVFLKPAPTCGPGLALPWLSSSSVTKTPPSNTFAPC